MTSEECYCKREPGTEEWKYHSEKGCGINGYYGRWCAGE